MSDFPTQVHALSSAARELRLSLLDNQAKITWIDAYSHTHLLEQWKKLREDYRGMLDESESVATRLATAMNTYVDLQEYMDDASMLDDLIEEFEGLKQNLENMHFRQEDDLSSLIRSFDRLRQDIDPLLKVHTAPVEDNVDAGEDASTRSPQEPATPGIYHYLERLGPRWHLNNHVVKTTSPQVEVTRTESTSSMATGRSASVTGIQAIPAVLQFVQGNLDLQRSMSRMVLVEMKDKLAHEIQTYLTALRNAQSIPSPENQLALRNATRRVTSSTGAWRERAKLLIDGYAKVPK